MDSKLRATNSVFDQVCETLNVNELSDDNDMIFQPGEKREISLHHNQPDIDAITLAILASYDVRSDAAALRHVLEDSVVDSAAYFDDLRNDYPIRREFSSMQIALTKQTPSLRQKLLNLGFRLIGSD
jgi:erythronate-4-phosphate dehydrogenase